MSDSPIAPLLSSIEKLTFSNLANVQTVGIGLYLALAVIQAVSAGGVAGLRRRSVSLMTAVRASKIVSEYAAVRQLQTEVSRIEIGFEALNRSILRAVLVLFIIALVYFGYTSIYPNSTSQVLGTAFIFTFYLVVPVAIFLYSTRRIAKECRGVRAKIESAEQRFLQKSLGD